MGSSCSPPGTSLTPGTRVSVALQPGSQQLRGADRPRARQPRGEQDVSADRTRPSAFTRTKTLTPVDRPGACRATRNQPGTKGRILYESPSQEAPGQTASERQDGGRGLGEAGGASGLAGAGLLFGATEVWGRVVAMSAHKASVLSAT